VAKKTNTTFESEHHVVGVRMRVKGEGNLDMYLTDLDDQRSYPMEPFVMQAATRIEPTRLANFQSQRIRFVGSIDELDEYFVISRIIIFAKPVAMEYPG
jgi:hypothetical protein